MKVQEAKRVINDFMASQGIGCVMASEDQRTHFWSYHIPNSRLLAWISIQEDEALVFASITLGILNQTRSRATLVKLLELNAHFTNGLLYATEMESLVTIRFCSSLAHSSANHLEIQLKDLQSQAHTSLARFCCPPDFQIEPLPSAWFQDGGTVGST